MNDQNAIIEENKRLIEKYPWLWPVDWFDLQPIPKENFDYTFTALDDIPEGWKKEFGEQMCEELQTVLKKHNCVELFRIIQIKEKYGGLRLYYSPLPEQCNREIRRVIAKYEDISEHTCCECGATAEYMSKGWICPYCKSCAESETERRGANPNLSRSVTIDDFFYPIKKGAPEEK